MLFSVIVPIYNVQKYLNRCIDSVLAQTFADYELILVDDGSPDECPAICDEYAAKDTRIQVIHKQNGGLVSARQAGIRVATGEYVIHLDGDDALLPGALESAQEIIEKHHPDMVCFSHKRCVDGIVGETVEDLAEEGLYHKADLEEKLYPSLLSNENMQNLFYFLWAKAIKRELATKYQLLVSTKISQGEDVSCTTPCYLAADTVYMSKLPVYLYTIRNDSLTTNFKTAQLTQIADTIIGLQKLDIQKPDSFDAQIARYSFFMCFAILAAAAEGGHFRAIPELKKLITGSLHKEQIQKAQFQHITIKTRISLFLMKRNLIRLTFYFLYLCKQIKHMKAGGKR